MPKRTSPPCAVAKAASATVASCFSPSDCLYSTCWYSAIKPNLRPHCEEQCYIRSGVHPRDHKRKGSSWMTFSLAVGDSSVPIDRIPSGPCADWYAQQL